MRSRVCTGSCDACASCVRPEAGLRLGWIAMTESGPVQSHLLHVQIERPIEDVATLLSIRPSTWIEPFLRLAGHPGVAYDRRPWYRLSAPVRGQDGGVVVRLIWWPHIGRDVFTSLTGELRVYQSHGTTLELSADTIGGLPHRNTSVLQTLLGLLGAAVEDDSPQ